MLCEMLESRWVADPSSHKLQPPDSAKAYECLRAGRPIFAMTDPAGDTASLLRAEGIEAIVPLDSKNDIATGLLRFLSTLGDGHNHVSRPVERHLEKPRHASWRHCWTLFNET